MPSRQRALGLAWLCALVLGAGCAATPDVPPIESLSKPEWKVGDRWVFRRTTLEGGTAVVTHLVTEATGDGYTVRITGLAREVTQHWTGDLHLSRQTVGGRPAGRFRPAAMYFAWPLTLGKAWSQEFEYANGVAAGRHAHTWRAGTVVESVNVLAGAFYALRIEHWGSQGQRLDAYWYSPRVRYWVRLENHLRGYTEELVEFTPLAP